MRQHQKDRRRPRVGRVAQRLARNRVEVLRELRLRRRVAELARGLPREILVSARAETVDSEHHGRRPYGAAPVPVAPEPLAPGLRREGVPHAVALLAHFARKLAPHLLGEKIAGQHRKPRLKRRRRGGLPRRDLPDERAALVVEEQLLRLGGKRLRAFAPDGRLVSATEFFGDIGEHVHLHGEVGLELRRLDRRQHQERRRVVPARVVAVVVFRKAVPVAVSPLEPPARHGRKAVVRLLELWTRYLAAAHHAAQRPAVDRRLHEREHDSSVARRVGNLAARVLVVEDAHELVPGEVEVRIGEAYRVERMVPAPDAVHPELRHENRLAAYVPARRNRRGPEEMRGAFARGGVLGRDGRQPREKALELGAPRLRGLVEGGLRQRTVPLGRDIPDRELERKASPRTDEKRARLRVASAPLAVDLARPAPYVEKELRGVLEAVGQHRLAAAAHGHFVDRLVRRGKVEVDLERERGGIAAEQQRARIGEADGDRARRSDNARRPRTALELHVLDGASVDIGDKPRDETLARLGCHRLDPHAGKPLGPRRVRADVVHGVVAPSRAERNRVGNNAVARPAGRSAFVGASGVRVNPGRGKASRGKRRGKRAHPSSRQFLHQPTSRRFSAPNFKL